MSDTRISTLDTLSGIKERGLQSLYPGKPRITVGAATCGLASGAGDVLVAIREKAKAEDLDVVVTETGCAGFCEKEPLVDILVPGKPRITYHNVTPEMAEELVTTLSNGDPRSDLALFRMDEEEYLIDDETREYPLENFGEAEAAIPLCDSLPFYSRQMKIALRNCGFIDPRSIDEYIARGGYRALHNTLHSLSSEEIIEEMKKSGLSGRGGGGFLTGRKWESCRNAPGEPKYVICNADEGDPGAYMDRSILEGDPHSVLEGMIIGAYAIGSHEGYIYVRAEYPLAIERLRRAISQAEEYGLLGENIFGSGFDFTITISRGGGAFVCGESTALMTSLEGRAGEPRAKYIHTVESGLWGKPSNLNNVETWANVPVIMVRGADWYSAIGNEVSTGTKVFSLVGTINNTGLVEVPMGVTLREIIFDIGGGIPGGRKFKAVQTGGPSGGCIPASHIDTPVDFDSLWELGSMMGSGGMIVMDETTCMVDVAKYFLEFLRDESCGKCVPCRVGVDRMYRILVDITEGRGQEGDIELLEELSETIKDTSLCALGGSAPNPVLSTIRYFRDEYEQHIKYKRCPGAVCKKIISSACQHTCPLGDNVPSYLGLIARGEFAASAALIRETNPLPSVCGRACDHPCELKCAAGQFGEPVAINDLKRFVMDWERRNNGGRQGGSDRLTPDLEKVAIIGSGPAGLVAAHDLARRGYRPTIFEALAVPGGMLAVGIPSYRLPREVLQYDIQRILDEGVELRTNTRVGEDLTLEDLREQGYKAILIAVGLHKSKPLQIDGVHQVGVLEGVTFLRDVALGNEIEIGERVIVVGGGNVAIDCARSALRVGAQEVHMAFLEPRDEMLAHPWDIKEALEEGIVFHPAMGPKRILEKDGTVAGLEIIECSSIFDEAGNFNPTFDPGTESVIEGDTVIISIGQTSDTSFLRNEQGGPFANPAGMIVADPLSQMTDAPDVFVAGDVFRGAGTISGAMASGRNAATYVHRYLRGLGFEMEYTVTRPLMKVEPLELSDDEVALIAEAGRQYAPELSVDERICGFREVRGPFDEATAIQQAKRCLRCDLEADTDDTDNGEVNFRDEVIRG